MATALLPSQPHPRPWLDVLVVIGLAGAIFAAVAMPQLRHAYPFTYDELVYMRKTRAYDQWLAEGARQALAGRPLWLFSRDAVERAEDLHDMHPGFVKLAALWPNWAVRLVLHREGGSRLVGALFMGLACGVLYLLLIPASGRLYAATAAVGLATLPRLFGHAHFEALDVPVMAVMLAAAAMAYHAAAMNRWRPALLAGVLLGAALATKLNGSVLLLHLGLWLALTRPPGAKKVLAGWLVAPPVFLLFWPWLWHDLPGKLSQYLAFHRHHVNAGTMYFGSYYGDTTTAPWHYPLVMLAVTLPLPWLLALLVGTVGMWRQGRAEGASSAEEAPARANQQNRLSPLSLPLLLVLGLALNLGLVMLPQAVRYNGDRLFLPAFPFAVAIGALGLRALTGMIRPRKVALAVAVLLAVGLAGGNVRDVVRTYPYNLSYYSRLIGGLRGAGRTGMEVTYWGQAYAGAAEFMRSHPQDRFVAAQEYATGVLDALIAAGEMPAQHRLLRRFVQDRIPDDADWLIVDNHPGLWPPAVAAFLPRATPALTVERDGVPLLWVFPLKPGQH